MCYPFRYHSQTSELIASVKKVEDSLRRLRVARAAGGGQSTGSGGKTDDDKIRHQVHLDTLAFIENVSCTESEKWSKLTLTA